MWVTELPSLWIWERNTTKGICSGFHWFQKVTKEAKDSSLLLKVMITIFESPLRIRSERSSYCAKRSAPNYCQSFNIVWKGGGGGEGLSHNEKQKQFPLSWITTTRPASLESWKKCFIKIDFKIRSSRKLKKKDHTKYEPIIIIYKSKNSMWRKYEVLLCYTFFEILFV